MQLIWITFKRSIDYRIDDTLKAREGKMMSDVSHLYQAIPTNTRLCMAHHFILLRLNPFDLRVDREGWWFKDFVS